MPTLSNRTDRFRADIRDKKVGCPAAHFLYDSRAEGDANASILTVGINGSLENQCGQASDAFRQFWEEERVRVLALFPENEPANAAQSSEYFRSIFFSLSQGSHQVFRDEVDCHLDSELPTTERSHWDEVNKIRFEAEELSYLQTHHGDQLWKYISSNTPLMMDLIAPWPTGDNSWMSNVIVIFTVAAFYPPYPEHLRHSDVSAMVLTKYEDLAILARSAEGSRAVSAWAEASRNRSQRGVHIEVPPVSGPESLALQESYLELRYRLTAEKKVRPVVITRNEELMMLAQRIEVSSALIQSLFGQYTTAQLIPVFRYCRANNIRGDEAIKGVIQQMERQEANL